MRTIPYARQDIDENDIEAVLEALRSDWLTQGPAIERFEAAVKEYCSASHAVAMSNATSALHVACSALGLGPNDTLWTSPITFVASANCARYCGADVDFVDIDPQTYNISVEALAEKLAMAESKGRLPKIVVPVHFSGQPSDMEAIGRLRERYGFSIVEDASHAIGSECVDERIGSCRHSDVTIFSFHPVKIITTAEGGMAVTNRPELADRMRLLRSHGITRDERLMVGNSEGAWYYQQIALGFNYRMTDLQAALGWSQLKRIDDFIARRTNLANRYAGLLRDLPVTAPIQRGGVRSSWHLYVIRLQLDMISVSRRDVFDALRGAGIGVNVHYIPVHLQPYYMNLGFRAGDFPAAEEFYEEALSLPLYPALSEYDQDRVVQALAACVA